MSKKEFANRDMTRFGEEKVSTYIPGWQKAAQKYGARASIEDLQEKLELEDSPELVEYANEGNVVLILYMKLQEMVLWRWWIYNIQIEG